MFFLKNPPPSLVVGTTCVRCRQPRPSFDHHELCAQCGVAAGKCLLHVGTSNPCSVFEVWPVKTWNKLRKALGDARTRAIQRGKPRWTSAFPQIVAWIANRPASVAASEPGSEISSVADSRDDFPTVNQIVSTKGSVLGDFEVYSVFWGQNQYGGFYCAMPRTPGTIETIETSDVPIVDLPQATPSVAGGVPILHKTELQLQYTLVQPPIAPVAMPQMALPLTAMPLAAMQQAPLMPAAMQPL